MKSEPRHGNYVGGIFVLPRPLVWQLYLLAWICGAFFAVWPLPSLICFILLVFAGKSLWNLPSLLLATALFISSSFLISHFLSQSERASAKLPSWAVNAGPYKGDFCGTISQTQGIPNRRVRITLENVHPQSENAGTDALPLYCALVREDNDPFFSPMPGQTVCFKGSIRIMRPNINSSSDADKPDWKIRKLLWQAYSNQRSAYFEISGEASFLYILREKVRRNFLLILGYRPGHSLSQRNWQAPDNQAKAILLALCFGDRRMLSYNTSDSFAAATLAHSLALSGQHLGIAGLLALGLVCCLGKWRPTLFLRFARIRLLLLLSIPLALLYLWLGNAPPSLIRAAGMLFLAAFYVMRGTSFTGLDLLCGAVLFFIIINPLSIFDIGLQLSVLCVFLIIIFSPFIAGIGKKIPKLSNPALDKILRSSCQIILVSMLIQLFLLPLNLLYFSIAGFFFPLNLLWLPMLGIFILPLAFSALFLSLLPGNISCSAAKILIDCSAYPCKLLLEFLEKLHSWHSLQEPAFLRPHWLFLLVFPILAISLAWLLAHRDKWKTSKLPFQFLLLACLLMLVPPALRILDYFNNKLSVEILDVGQGLSILLKTPQNLRILYDGGGSATSHFDPGKNLVAPFLAQNKAPRVDAVINSHPDMDHLGGLIYILENFKSGQLYHNGHEAGGVIKERWEGIKKVNNARALYAGDVIFLEGKKDGLRLEVLHPPASTLSENKEIRYPDETWQGNHASLVLRLSQGGEGLLLLTGDAEKDVLKNLLSSGQNLKARVLVAPHHGSDRSLLRSFYREVNPELVLAGCAFQNRWNYPGKKLRKFLEELDIPLLDTGRSGKIKVNFENDGKLAIMPACSGADMGWLNKIQLGAEALISGNADKKQ